MNSKLFIAVCLVMLCGACKDKDAIGSLEKWTAQAVCVAQVTSGDKRSAAAVSRDFRKHNIVYTMGGSGVWSICVHPEDAERARTLLKANNELLVISDTNGIVEIIRRRK